MSSTADRNESKQALNDSNDHRNPFELITFGLMCFRASKLEEFGALPDKSSKWLQIVPSNS